MTLTDDQIRGWTEEKMRREEDQAWECAGLARQDSDTADEKRWTEAARRIARLRVEVYGG